MKAGVPESERYLTGCSPGILPPSAEEEEAKAAVEAAARPRLADMAPAAAAVGYGGDERRAAGHTQPEPEPEPEPELVSSI